MYHVLSQMTLRQLMDYRLVSSVNKQEYKNRREDAAEVVAHYFGIFTAWHIVTDEQRAFLPKGSLSVAAASMGTAFFKITETKKWPSHDAQK